jgi:hypothetical protein
VQRARKTYVRSNRTCTVSSCFSILRCSSCVLLLLLLLVIVMMVVVAVAVIVVFDTFAYYAEKLMAAARIRSRETASMLKVCYGSMNSASVPRNNRNFKSRSTPSLPGCSPLAHSFFRFYSRVSLFACGLSLAYRVHLRMYLHAHSPVYLILPCISFASYDRSARDHTRTYPYISAGRLLLDVLWIWASQHGMLCM